MKDIEFWKLHNKEELYFYLKNNNIKPNYFGLGFIQCKISESIRAHFYHPSIQPIVNIEEEIHDHRYNFTSYILHGKLINKRYKFVEDDNGQYIKQFESCNKNIEVKDQKITIGNIENFGKSDNLIENCNYYMDHRWFHTIQSENCVTLLRRSEYKKEYSNVIRPINSEKICPFSKTVDAQECWNIIKELLLK